MDGEGTTKAQLGNTQSREMISVIFTGTDETLKALEKARELAGPLSADIAVIVVQVVPFPLPLDKPPISLETVLSGFEECASQFPEKVRVFNYLCRDEMDGFNRALKRNRPVVIGIPKSLLPTREERLAHTLRHAGYDIILVSQEQNKSFGKGNHEPII